MSKLLTTVELANMAEKDLLREIEQQRREVTKVRLALKLGKEKGSHHLHAAKNSLARILTALVRLRTPRNPITIS